MEDIFKTMDDESLWKSYGLTIHELEKRKLIRTRNIAGERGEQLAIKFYNSISNEPNLQEAPPTTQNVDALSRKGERYTIKTITLPRKATGVFFGLNPQNSDSDEQQKFEYVILVLINELFEPIKILELTWSSFLKHKRWHKTARAWYLYLTKELENDLRVVWGKNEK